MKVKDTALVARQIKAGPDDGLLEGQFTAYASVFGNEDSYGDVVMPGAFADDLARWKDSGQNIPLLFGHNMADPDFNLGHLTDAGEDDKGLLVTAQLDLENPKAAQVFRMLKGRRINQMSFAYDVLEGESVTSETDGVKSTHYELRKLKVYEVSVVTIGANQETEILAVKSAAAAMLVKAGRTISAKNETALRSAHDQLIGAADEIKNVLSSLDASDSDQEKATGETEAKSDATDETGAEPGKSTVSDEEPKSGPSVDLWATHLSLLALGTPE